MQAPITRNLADLDLYVLPFEEPVFVSDPYHYIEEARKRHPWVAKCASGYVVFQYSAIKDLPIELPPA